MSIEISITELRETPISVEFKTIDVKNKNNEDDKILIITVDVSVDRELSC